jgi:hypothetical protein
MILHLHPHYYYICLYFLQAIIKLIKWEEE